MRVSDFRCWRRWRSVPPVLTSREGSLPEVAGDAALFVDAYDPSDIAHGLERLSSDDALCADLSARGLARAQHFDMTAYQARLGALYDRVLAYRRP